MRTATFSGVYADVHCADGRVLRTQPPRSVEFDGEIITFDFPVTTPIMVWLTSCTLHIGSLTCDVLIDPPCPIRPGDIGHVMQPVHMVSIEGTVR